MYVIFFASNVKLIDSAIKLLRLKLFNHENSIIAKLWLNAKNNDEKELYKTEQNRSGISSAGGVGMTKVDIEKDSFKPQEFRSSRSNRNQTTSSTNNNNNATSSRNDHEKAMFGSGPNAMFNPIQPVSTSSLPTVAEKTLMHSSVQISALFNLIYIRSD